MNQNKSVIIILAALFVLAVLGANLAIPTDTFAHPKYGFTPPAPPPPGDDDGDNGGGNEDSDESDTDNELPPDYVLVELDRCDLSCSANFNGTTAGHASPLSTPTEVIVHVQLVHQGSGWIAEGLISDSSSTRVAVPYPGQWEVFMIGEPEFVGAAPFDVTGLNLDQLRNSLAVAPVSLGLVETNTAEPQLVKCPIACVIDPPPEILPETGADQTTTRLLILTNLTFLFSLGLSTFLTRRKEMAQAPCDIKVLLSINNRDQST